MHGLIALDADQRPLTPLVTWADSRSREQAAELRASGEARELHRRSGTPVHPMTPLTKLLWFARHEPGTFAAARWWVGLKDFLLQRLTGRLVTELSSASATGLLDMATRTWNADALALAGISEEQLPPILPSTATLPLAPGPRGGPGCRRAAGGHRRGRRTARQPRHGRADARRRRALARHQRRDPDGRPGAAGRRAGDALLLRADRDAWVVGGADQQRRRRRALGRELARSGPRARGRRGACSSWRRASPPAATGW